MHAFYINLDRRTDRRTEIEKELSDKGIDFERFPAIEFPYQGHIGCSLSHLTVLKIARERKYESVMVFEDDFEFLVSKEEWDQLIARLPKSYDVVMLGYNVMESLPYDDTFDQAVSVQTTSGFIVHSKFYETLINRWQEGVNRFVERPQEEWNYCCDQYWKALQPVSEWYVYKTRIGRQRAGFSDLAKNFVDYGV
jgi:glycosyl transferase family 25